MDRRLRNFVFRLHTWLGLHLSLFLAFLFFTGAILVIAPELQVAFQPNVWVTMPGSERTASLGQMYDMIATSYPDATIDWVVKHHGAWMADKVHAHTSWGEEVIFWTNPVNGAIVDITRSFGFEKIIKRLHENLLADHRFAYLFVSGVSILLLVLITAGLMSYRRFWRGFFRRPSSHSGQRGWLGGLHRLLAVWSFTMLLIIALTSFVFFLGGLGIKGHVPKPSPAQTRQAVLPNDFGTNRINDAEAAARMALPGFTPASMVPPHSPSDGILFLGPKQGLSPLMGEARVAVDPMTLEILGIFTPSDNRGIARIRALVNHLHFGTWGGLPAKLLWVALGLVMANVAVTGILTFAARQPRPVEGSTNPGALRFFWRGLGLFRWIYVLLVLGVIAVSVYHYGPFATQRIVFRALESDAPPVRLLADQPLRAGVSITLQLQIPQAGIRDATIQINSSPPRTIPLRKQGARLVGTFEFQPERSANMVTVHFSNPTGDPQTLNYALGRAIW